MGAACQCKHAIARRYARGLTTCDGVWTAQPGSNGHCNLSYWVPGRAIRFCSGLQPARVRLVPRQRNALPDRVRKRKQQVERMQGGQRPSASLHANRRDPMHRLSSGIDEMKLEKHEKKGGWRTFHSSG